MGWCDVAHAVMSGLGKVQPCGERLEQRVSDVMLIKSADRIAFGLRWSRSVWF